MMTNRHTANCLGHAAPSILPILLGILLAAGPMKSANELPSTIRRLRMRTARKVLESVPGFRSVAFCARRVVDRGAGVSVVVGRRSDGAPGVQFRGVGVCGGVWVCPECAAVIGERRAQDVIQATRVWTQHKQGGQIGLLTLTFPHSRQDVLAAMMDRLKKAMKVLQESSAYKMAVKHAGIAGHIRALEVTTGYASGWHPHFHFLLFFKGSPSQIALDVFRAELLECWQRACSAAGLGCPNERHGVDLKVVESLGEIVAAYVGKHGHEPRATGWGPERELTKLHQKKAKFTGKDARFTPFALLDVVENGSVFESRRASEWFREYAQAFKGMNHLRWKVGFKAILAGMGAVFDERSDEEIAQEEPVKAMEAEKVLCAVSASDWEKICKARLVDVLTDLLLEYPSKWTVLNVVERARLAEVRRVADFLMFNRAKEKSA